MQAWEEVALGACGGEHCRHELEILLYARRGGFADKLSAFNKQVHGHL